MEENKPKFLSEENYQNNKKKIKTVGKALLCIGVPIAVIGLVLLIVGIAQQSASFEAFEPGLRGVGMFVGGGFMLVIGFALCGWGGAVLLFAHKRDILAYTATGAVPVVKEVAEDFAPTAGKVVKTIVSSVKEGFEESAKCPNCGGTAKKNAKFCPECGEKLNVKIICPNCGKEIAKNSKFCPECGEKQ